MRHSLKRIISNPINYKLCNRCSNLNWHENKKCWVCYTTSFNTTNEFVEKFINEEKTFYIKEYPIRAMRCLLQV